MKQIANDPAKLDELWKRVDYNGNGIVSLAEFDKLVVRAAAGGVCEGAAGGVRRGRRAEGAAAAAAAQVETFPPLNHKPALIRAFKHTTQQEGDSEPFVRACAARQRSLSLSRSLARSLALTGLPLATRVCARKHAHSSCVCVCVRGCVRRCTARSSARWWPVCSSSTSSTRCVPRARWHTLG